MGENRPMADLYEENQRLKARIEELEEKHWNECGQIAHYDDELKDLREENKVLISECDRLIKEKGELLKKSEQIAEYKRLLKAAVEDMNKEADCGICLHDNDSECPIKVTACKFKWRHAAEALALIGEDTKDKLPEEGARNDDCIERKKAIELIQPHVKPQTIYGEGYLQAIEHATDILELMPAADVQPVKRGKWIWKKRHRNSYRVVKGIDKYGKEGNLQLHEEYKVKVNYCSVCGKQGHEAFLNYCPNCGARMDGEQDD